MFAYIPSVYNCILSILATCESVTAKRFLAFACAMQNPPSKALERWIHVSFIVWSLL